MNERCEWRSEGGILVMVTEKVKRVEIGRQKVV